MTKHAYFVSFLIVKHPYTNIYYPRNILVELDKQIESIQDIREIEQDIIQHTFGEEYISHSNLVVINNWKEMLR